MLIFKCNNGIIADLNNILTESLQIKVGLYKIVVTTSATNFKRPLRIIYHDS